MYINRSRPKPANPNPGMPNALFLYQSNHLPGPPPPKKIHRIPILPSPSELPT